jgi:hypothetical protein
MPSIKNTPQLSATARFLVLRCKPENTGDTLAPAGAIL